MTRPPQPREHWKFLGREKHYGCHYLIWELAANPRGHAKIGSRWVRFVG